MAPELHGWEHVDYGEYTKSEVLEDLRRSIDVMVNKLHCHPSKFYTPWGANSPEIQEAAKELNLEVVDCSDINQLKKLAPALGNRHYAEYCKLYKDHGEVMIHFWEGFCWQTPELVTRYLECIMKEERYYVGT